MYNCYYYVNKIVEVLCIYFMCLDWCEELYLEKGDFRMVIKFVWYIIILLLNFIIKVMFWY